MRQLTKDLPFHAHEAYSKNSNNHKKHNDYDNQTSLQSKQTQESYNHNRKCKHDNHNMIAETIVIIPSGSVLSCPVQFSSEELNLTEMSRRGRSRTDPNSQVNHHN